MRKIGEITLGEIEEFRKNNPEIVREVEKFALNSGIGYFLSSCALDAEEAVARIESGDYNDDEIEVWEPFEFQSGKNLASMIRSFADSRAREYLAVLVAAGE